MNDDKVKAAIDDFHDETGRGQEGRRGMRTITHKQFLDELSAQGVQPRDFAFRCVVCGTIQSPQSFLNAGVPEDLIMGQIGFSCVGRWTKVGPHKPGTAPGKGCDWTLGGLFRFHKLEVVTEDGKTTPVFEIATPAEAAKLAEAGKDNKDA
jgi:hypothetical protein